MDTKLIGAIVVIVIVAVSGIVYVTFLSTPPLVVDGVMQLSDLNFSPSGGTVFRHYFDALADEGETVTISIQALNTGGTTITETVTLKLNDEVEASDVVSLTAEESKTISWVLDKEKGIYSVNASGLIGTFSVGDLIELNIITRHDTTIHTLFEPAYLESNYAKKHNIADLRWWTPTDALWVETIGAIDMDVAWGGGPTLFDTLILNNLLAALEDGSYAIQMVNMINDTIAGNPMKRFDNQGNVLWAAAAISSFGFTINEDFLVDAGIPVPNKWEDLANETYGKLLPIPSIAMGNAPGTTSNTRIYEIIIQAFGWNEGWRLLTRMAGNSGIYGGSVETQSAVETNTVGVSMSIDFYGYTSQLAFPNLQYVLPEGQSIINGDPVALVDKSKHKEATQDFIGWLLSPEGQSIWLDEKINRMPVRSDTFQTVKGQQRVDLYERFNTTIRNIGIPFSDVVALSYEQSLKYYFEAVLKNSHESLASTQGVWTELVRAKEEQRITQQQFSDLILELGTPVSWTDPTDQTLTQFTEEYAISINDRMYSDSTFRGLMVGIWGEAAIAQYQSILDKIPQT